MSDISAEDALAVGKLVYPERAWGIGHGNVAVYTEFPSIKPAAWRAYDPTDPAECWAMVCYIARNQCSPEPGVIRLRQAYWLVKAILADDPAALVAMVLGGAE